MQNKEEIIDFVITWVDGNDINWINEKKKYTSSNYEDDRVNRYRDWENLKYWFRGIEKFAPWVNKIHFVTCGHVPEWLNLNNSKLNIVNHSDIIDSKFLPVFNSQAIEMNLHKIEGLSEKFVYFNDDIFIISYVKETDFFKNGLPCDSCILDLISPNGNADKDPFQRVLFNNINIINRNFNKKEYFIKSIDKYIRPFKYRKEIIRTFLLLPWPRFTGFFNLHGPNSYLKSTFKEVWNKEEKAILDTCSSKFRSDKDLNQYIFRYWQLAAGKIYPRSYKFSKYFELSNDNRELYSVLERKEFKVVCINDSDDNINFEEQKIILNKFFERILPEKSEFEL